MMRKYFVLNDLLGILIIIYFKDINQLMPVSFVKLIFKFYPKHEQVNLTFLGLIKKI
jgi:hypothetical protein